MTGKYEMHNVVGHCTYVGGCDTTTDYIHGYTCESGDDYRCDLENADRNNDMAPDASLIEAHVVRNCRLNEDDTFPTFGILVRYGVAPDPPPFCFAPAADPGR